MARVALIGHSRPKSSRVKARISKANTDHAVAKFMVESVESADVVNRRIL